MSRQKERLAIDGITILINTVQEKWKEKKLIIMIFINIKKTFEYISKR